MSRRKGVCRFWAQGRCTRGDQCWFEHPAGGGGGSSNRSGSGGGGGGGRRDGSGSRRDLRQFGGGAVAMELSRTHFTGFGQPGQASLIRGDISPAELRWLISCNPPAYWQSQLSKNRQEMDVAINSGAGANGGPSEQNPFAAGTLSTPNPFAQPQQPALQQIHPSFGTQPPAAPATNPFGAPAASASAFPVTPMNSNNNGSGVFSSMRPAAPPSRSSSSTSTFQIQPLQPTALNVQSQRSTTTQGSQQIAGATTTTTKTTTTAHNGQAVDSSSVVIPEGFPFIAPASGVSAEDELKTLRQPEFALDRIPENVLLLEIR